MKGLFTLKGALKRALDKRALQRTPSKGVLETVPALGAMKVCATGDMF